jgi:hypothetical protein
MNFLPQLASKYNSPNLSLARTWDYRHEPLVAAQVLVLIYNKTIG